MGIVPRIVGTRPFEKFRLLGRNVIRVGVMEGKDLKFPHADFAAWRRFFGTVAK